MWQIELLTYPVLVYLAEEAKKNLIRVESQQGEGSAISPDLDSEDLLCPVSTQNSRLQIQKR
jgi:hypothetical protein